MVWGADASAAENCVCDTDPEPRTPGTLRSTSWDRQDGKLVPRPHRWRWLDDRTSETLARGDFITVRSSCRDRQAQLGREYPVTAAAHVWGLLELQTGVTPGDPRSAHGSVRISGTGRRGHGQACPHASRQSPVPARVRLGGEELVNHPRRWPVGHGPIQAGGRLLATEPTFRPRRPGSQYRVLGHNAVAAAATYCL